MKGIMTVSDTGFCFPQQLRHSLQNLLVSTAVRFAHICPGIGQDGQPGPRCKHTTLTDPLTADIVAAPPQ